MDGQGGVEKAEHRLLARHRGGWPVLVLRVVIILVLLWVAVWLGTHATEDVREFEKMVDEMGAWGPVFFLLALVILTSFFFPDSVFGLAAGVMFGLWWGTLLMVVAVSLTAVLNFWMSRKVMRGPFQRYLERHAKLKAVERAANEGGLRLVMLLRLAPINPVTVSYTLGVSEISLKTFVIGLVGMVPGLFAEVYFGVVGAHVASLAGGIHHHSVLQSVVTIGGFVVCVVGMIWIARMTRKALAEAAEEMGETRLDSTGE